MQLKNDQNSQEQSDKSMTIIVNGRSEIIQSEQINFEELVTLAFNPVPTGPNVIFTITYRRGHGNKKEGSLLPGESIRVKKEMIFNVTLTDKS